MKRQCKYCKTKFEPKRYWQKFCSKECKIKMWHIAKAEKYKKEINE